MTPKETTGPITPFSCEDIAWTEWSEVPRFGVRFRHLSGAALGERYHVGVAIEELAPGKQSGPQHWHVFEEEHVFILDGALTLRLGDQTHPMKAGDYVCLPAGQAAGHCLINDSGAVCRYVIIGERNPKEVAVYVESNKVLVRALGRRAIFDLTARRRYWDGVETGLAEDESPPLDPDETAPIPADAQGRPPISSHDVDWDERLEGAVFADCNKHLTYAAVGEGYRVGVLIEGPPPGRRSSPRHYHLLEEEHALVLEGEVTLLLGEERHVMRPGDYVCFLAGRRVGHSFLNSGEGPCAYLMIGERNPNDVVVYPDSDKVSVRALEGEGQDSIFDMAGVRKYYDGEETG